MQLKSLWIPISSGVASSFDLSWDFLFLNVFANSVMLTMFALKPIGGAVIRRRGVSLLNLFT